MRRYLKAAEYRATHAHTETRGPNGRRLCVCGTEVPKGARFWCSRKCVDVFREQNDWTWIRRQVAKRDRGVCALCGWDARKGRDEFFFSYKRNSALAVVAALNLGIPEGRLWADWWDADHVIPLVEGGDNRLSNVRTLCVPCHKKVTAELRKRLSARKRKPEK